MTCLSVLAGVLACATSAYAAGSAQASLLQSGDHIITDE
eukprot:CAMPEP_0171246672 /NCGR_PEP_ID=MMETSP0790-20130122/48080_1 /TAXON_ID=2925 /ORGANISM="Alexandrium catenella, Strain OF101" /LENGTH=38 /DNA_ID= /DNA_START= /DNA_END= /DNA_ORIENTATION=